MAQVRGPFPFPTAQVNEGGGRIQLASGGLFYFPAGDWMINNDSHNQIEWWDPISQIWISALPVSSAGPISTDGFNFRLRNIFGSASLTTISNAGAATATNGIGSAINGVSAAVAASDTTGYPTITLQTIVGGSVAAPTITQAGSGFVNPPLIVIDPPPPGGIQATAYAVLTAAGGSGIASINMVTVGAGYATTPNFWIIPQPAIYQGSTTLGTAAGGIPAPGLVFPGNAVPGNQNTSSTGAQLTSIALTGSGTLTGLVIVNNGGGYTTASPAVTFTGGGSGIAATVTVTNNTNVRGITVAQPRVQA